MQYIRRLALGWDFPRQREETCEIGAVRDASPARDFLVQGSKLASTRLTMSLSSTVDLPHSIDIGALCGASLVTLPSNFEPIEPLEVHRAVRFESLGVRVKFGVSGFRFED